MSILSLLVNGSFESPAISTSFITLTGAGDTTITGWVTGRGSIELNASYWQAADGNQSIDLSGNRNGSIHQDLTTVVGQTYVVTFDLSGNPDGGSAHKRLQVRATDLISSTVSSHYYYFTVLPTQTRADMNYQVETFTFVATSTSTRLGFVSRDRISDPYGPVIDNVTLSTAPTMPSVPEHAAGVVAPQDQTAGFVAGQQFIAAMAGFGAAGGTVHASGDVHAEAFRPLITGPRMQIA